MLSGAIACIGFTWVKRRICFKYEFWLTFLVISIRLPALRVLNLRVIYLIFRHLQNFRIFIFNQSFSRDDGLAGQNA